jgi:hypothetical protein
MPSNPVPDARVEPSVDDQFLDMVCADEDLLRAEFEAIIAAKWPTPPTPRGHRARVPPRPTGIRRPRPPRSGQVGQRPRHPGVGGWARQRSPPPRQPSTSDRKAGDRPR